MSGGEMCVFYHHNCREKFRYLSIIARQHCSFICLLLVFVADFEDAMNDIIVPIITEVCID